MASLERSIEKHSKSIEKILDEKFTLRPDWANCAVAEIMDLLKDWSKGDDGAHAVLLKLVRGEFKASNFHTGQLRALALKALVSVGPRSVDELLALLRDDKGNLLFRADNYRPWPDDVLAILEDLAVAGVEPRKLAFEFISIGAKLDKLHCSDNRTGIALYNIKRMVFGDDEKRLFAPPLPQFSEDEKDFLAKRTYGDVVNELDAHRSIDYDLASLRSSKAVVELIRLFETSNRSDKEVLQALMGFMDDSRVPPELMKIFLEGAIRLDDGYKALALKALIQVQDRSFKDASVIYRCEAIKDSSRTYTTSVEMNVGDLLVLLDIAYLNFNTFAPAIPLKKDVSDQRGIWFEVRDKRISRLTFAQGRGIWNSTAADIASLPDSIGQLTELRDLDLSGQSQITALPASLKDLKGLVLHLEGTGISAPRS